MEIAGLKGTAIASAAEAPPGPDHDPARPRSKCAAAADDRADIPRRDPDEIIAATDPRPGERGETHDDAAVDGGPAHLAPVIAALEAKRRGRWYAYLCTWDFWTVVLLGQVLCLCNTGTSTFSTLLVNRGTSIPAFQSLFNYVLLFLFYATYTVYRYGFKKYCRLFLVDGWKYFILSFMDVEGNYFTVLAYRYTTILSAQLINFWSIVCVVLVSAAFLKVRYQWRQIGGILLCCAGQGILLASDHVRGANGGAAPGQLKGDLFCLLGATCYGLSNVVEEWFVSRRPVHEVLGMLGAFGLLVNGAQAGLLDRASFRAAAWTGPVGADLAGYTLLLFLFYSLAPLLLRLASAAFFDISLLTGNFWGVAIGVGLFAYSLHFLYPIAFVLILLGLLLYFLSNTALGDSKKPWLGEGQEDGVIGIGTAKWKAIREARKASRRGETTPIV